MGHCISKDQFGSSRRRVYMTRDNKSGVVYKLQKPDRVTFSDVYKLLPQATLGHGIDGQVQQCIHRPTGKLHAVKIISKSRNKPKDAIKREIEFLTEARHPNIIKMLDAYENKKEVHIVTEICHGGELFDRILEKASQGQIITDDGRETTPAPACFREVEAARIIYRLLSAVSYLHSKDIVHRDIKPENVLFVDEEHGVEYSPVIRLIDLGLSVRHTADHPPLTGVVGSSYYMAPEILESSYDRSCDLWAVGVVAYLMLDGRPPFDGRTDDDIFKEIRRGLPVGKLERLGAGDNGDTVSTSAKDFISRLLDVNPRTRWTADKALSHEWLKLAKIDDIFGSGL